MRLKLLKQVTRNLRKSEYSQSPFRNLQKKEAVVGEKKIQTIFLNGLSASYLKNSRDALLRVPASLKALIINLESPVPSQRHMKCHKSKQAP